MSAKQPLLSEGPDASLSQEEVRRAADGLVKAAGTYRRSEEFRRLIEFIGRFPAIAAYNAFLLHIQRPGAIYVASADQWAGWFQRRVKPGARPLVILVPFGPVGFLYDVSDTDGKEVPKEVLHPFNTQGLLPPCVFDTTLLNLFRDRVYYAESDMGTALAGSIRHAPGARQIPVGDASVKALYQVLVNRNLEDEPKYASMVHELAHLYCGHIGSPDETWWPNRSTGGEFTGEFEAETVTWLVCERLGIDNPSAEFIAGYLNVMPEVPEISLECVLKAVLYIETMGKRRLGERRESRFRDQATRGVSVK